MPALTAEHLQQITFARLQGAKIRRAATVATLDGWTTGIFAALTLLSM